MSADDAASKVAAPVFIGALRPEFELKPARASAGQPRLEALRGAVSRRLPGSQCWQGPSRRAQRHPLAKVPAVTVAVHHASRERDAEPPPAATKAGHWHGETAWALLRERCWNPLLQVSMCRPHIWGTGRPAQRPPPGLADDRSTAPAQPLSAWASISTTSSSSTTRALRQRLRTSRQPQRPRI